MNNYLPLIDIDTLCLNEEETVFFAATKLSIMSA
jgi:hypothetical protein